MEKFKFYEVDTAYAAYLRQYEPKIPNITYATNDKFLCGVLFKINGMNYYAPISSFTKPQKTNMLIKNRTGRITSSIRFCFMFPVPDDKVRMKDFSKEDPSYRRLLWEELSFCRRNADQISSTALHIYATATSGLDKTMQRNCCNFKRLEALCLQYTRQQLSTDQPRKSVRAALDDAKVQASSQQTATKTAATPDQELQPV